MITSRRRTRARSGRRPRRARSLWLAVETLEARCLLSAGPVGELAPDAALDTLQKPAAEPAPVAEHYLIFDDYGGGPSDAEKSLDNVEDDRFMCWAAAASNVLDWTGWGEVDGMQTADEMFDCFVANWTNQGGKMIYAWEWWFNGTNQGQGIESYSQVEVRTEGFYPDEPFEDYLHFVDDDAAAMQSVDAFLHAGYGVTLGLPHDYIGGHAVTCWGFSTAAGDPTAYTGVWVTNSDDDMNMADPPDALRYYEVEFVDGHWYLQDYSCGGWYIGTVAGIEPKPEPEQPWTEHGAEATLWAEAPPAMLDPARVQVDPAPVTVLDPVATDLAFSTDAPTDPALDAERFGALVDALLDVERPAFATLEVAEAGQEPASTALPVDRLANAFDSGRIGLLPELA